MTTATVHVLPAGIGDGGQDHDHAATVDALVTELGALAVQLADARAQLDQLDAMRAAFMARSDERDRWSALSLARFGEGYRAGGEAGEVIGAGRAIIGWKVTAGALPLSAGGPTYAEIDRKRYPSHRPGVPDGRLSWIIPRAGERCAHDSACSHLPICQHKQDGKPCCPHNYDGCPYAAEGINDE